MHGVLQCQYVYCLNHQPCNTWTVELFDHYMAMVMPMWQEVRLLVEYSYSYTITLYRECTRISYTLLKLVFCSYVSARFKQGHVLLNQATCIQSSAEAFLGLGATGDWRLGGLPEFTAASVKLYQSQLGQSLLLT